MPRCFIAIPVPPDISDKLSQSLHGLLPDLKLVPASNQHITLAFLGNQSKENIEQIGKRLSELTFSAIEIIIDRIAPFPKPASTILAGWVRPCQALLFIWETINSMLHEANVASYDDRDFLPHITLARNKPVKPVRSRSIELIFTANCVNLYLSESVNGRRTYSIIKSISATIT